MDELDEILSELDEDEEVVEEKSVQTVSNQLPTQIPFNGMMVDVEDDNALTTMILTSALEDKKKADDLFDIFEANVAMSKDRSDSSKEALTKAVEIRVQATTNLVKILDVKSKSKQNTGNNFINFQVSPKKAGIDIKNVKDNLEEFE
jgi:formate-dependent nitrite reductase cytochrome c552 subunit